MRLNNLSSSLCIWNFMTLHRMNHGILCTYSSLMRFPPQSFWNIQFYLIRIDCMKRIKQRKNRRWRYQNMYGINVNKGYISEKHHGSIPFLWTSDLAFHGHLQGLGMTMQNLSDGGEGNCEGWWCYKLERILLSGFSQRVVKKMVCVWMVEWFPYVLYVVEKSMYLNYKW